jgi:phage I-like protein
VNPQARSTTVTETVPMTSRAALTVLTAILTTSPPVLAAESANTQVKETGHEDSSTEASPLSATDLSRARAWGLSETESVYAPAAEIAEDLKRLLP